MDNFPLTIIAGKTARARIEQEGWHPELFTSMVGASGGAKLLGIAHLDRFLFGDFLQRSSHRMALYGSSIGAWRHAALAAPDPLVAISALQNRYLNQAWDPNDPRSPREVVDELCDWVLDGFLDQAVSEHIAANPRFDTHIVTVRGLGWNNRQADVRLALSMGYSAFGNLLNRNWLQRGFQRVVFSTAESTDFSFSDFDTLHVPLTPELVRPAIVATGSIPFLMSGVKDIPSAPPGQYWDGGVVDYHFDFANHSAEEGLTLYPHFSRHVVKGWFDKRLPWRRNSEILLDRVVVIAPSEAYLASLPGGKIPDRKDFSQLDSEERLRRWHISVDRSRELADALKEIVASNNPGKLWRSD